VRGDFVLVPKRDLAMSEEATVYGAVMLWRADSQRAEGYTRNRDVVGALPQSATYPGDLLTRGMFTAPLEELARLGLYRYQVIHFGASYNHLSEFWHLWLEQFEHLLRRLMWMEAHLHLSIETCGDHSYHWKAVIGGWEELAANQGVKQWTFHGGPRTFVQE
jgi:hypothetical protein